MSGAEGELELDRRELAESALSTAVVVGVLDPDDDGRVELLAALPDPPPIGPRAIGAFPETNLISRAAYRTVSG